MYTHYAHCKNIIVKEGDIVLKGTIIGYCGDTGTTPTPGIGGQSHLHFEIQKNDPAIRGFSVYTSGLTVEEVQSIYEDPYVYLQGKFEPLVGGKVGGGYDWLQINNKGQVHPGIDLNVGGGYDDYGLPIYACEDSVVYKVIYNDGGWGNHLFLLPINNLEEQELMSAKDEILAVIADLKKEQDKMLQMMTNRNGENRLENTGKNVSQLVEHAGLKPVGKKEDK